MKLLDVTAWLDSQFVNVKVDDVAHNGLQFGANWDVDKVGLAVDARITTFRKAATEGCGLLIVHHGLLWGHQFPITGAEYRRMSVLLQNHLALYAQHLPLDMHPEYGNNAQILAKLGLTPLGKFGNWHGNQIGYYADLPEQRDIHSILPEMLERLNLTGELLEFGKKQIRRVGVVSGGPGTNDLVDAFQHGVDLVITGEKNHAAHSVAQDWGINVLFCGHYATEVFGVKALGRALEAALGIPCVFIHFPTMM